MAIVRKRSRRGGPRAHAGRPVVYRGKTEKVSIVLTVEAVALLQSTRESLTMREGRSVTLSDAAEHLIRAGGKP